MELSNWEAAWLEAYGYHLDSELTEKETSATKLLPVKSSTLRKWRCVGVAGGYACPKFKRIANQIFYTPRDCFEWRRETTQEHGGVAA